MRVCRHGKASGKQDYLKNVFLLGFLASCTFPRSSQCLLNILFRIPVPTGCSALAHRGLLALDKETIRNSEAGQGHFERDEWASQPRFRMGFESFSLPVGSYCIFHLTNQQSQITDKGKWGNTHHFPKPSGHTVGGHWSLKTVGEVAHFLRLMTDI